MTETKTKKTKKPRKKYPRPTTARFSTEECKILLECVKFSRQKDHFWDQEDTYRRMVYKIEDRLRERIKKEEKGNANGGGDQRGATGTEKSDGDNGSSPNEPQVWID